jgi:outer membrane protein OmpA-like peptidoglycan-associated protein
VAILCRAAAAALALGLLSGCARQPVVQVRAAAPAPPPPTRDDLYVLLPSPDGKPASVIVRREGQERLLDTPYAAARIRGPGGLETGTTSAEEVQQVFGAALAAQPARPVSFTLYFLEGKDELTPDSKQLVQQVFAEIARRPVPEVLVIGHTDRIGSVPYNDGLSLQRAERMRVELVKLGIPAERIQATGRGEREPLVPTEDEVPEPRNRRVEITVR